jgi:putative membrane-bound dehydrogenase-like protein
VGISPSIERIIEPTMQRSKTTRTFSPLLPLFVWALTLPALACAQDEAQLTPEVRGSALSPAVSLASMHVAPGLRVELVAAEPQVADPVAIAFDENGRLWVVEMADYPNGPPDGQPPLSRIRLLEDRDGDGQYELSRIFADRILFPNGIQPWHGGVIVTAAPYILYLKDTDGDGRADVEQKLFEGFAALNPQLRVNHPTFGPDNWIYVANGLRGGSVRPLATGSDKPAKSISVSGRDFRFRLASNNTQSHDRQGAPALITRQYEPITGMGQFGLTFDDWGRRFVCDNRHHLRLVVMEDRYTGRNPYLAAPSLLDDIPVHGAAAEVFSLGRAWTTSILHAGTFTACCGVHVYRGDLLPEEYRGNAFVCEPPGSLVHRDVLEPAGATLKARRAREGVEFLASTDDWFRPVNLTTGPDGALYVVDMYRAIIEHPEFMPAELKGRPELALGRNRGRIYRIVPDKAPAPAHQPHLSNASAAELVELLEHPNAWWRETAQRLLVERQAREAVASLDHLLRSTEDPRARVHAAWTLEGLRALETRHVERLLADPNARVREHALQLAEPTLRRDPSELWGKVRALVGDPDARVRFQAVLTLGELPLDFKNAHQGDYTEALSEVAARDAEDPWTRLAVASAVPEDAALLANRLLVGGGFGALDDASPDRIALMRELFRMVGARRDEGQLDAAFATIFQLDAEERLAWQMACLEGMTDGIGSRGGRLDQLVQLVPKSHRKRAEAEVHELFARIADLAVEQNVSVPQRERAVELLRHAPAETALAALVPLLGPNSPRSLELAAIRSLAAHGDERIPELLLARWSTATPPTRREIVAGLLRTPARTRLLLDAVKQKQILPGELTSTEARRLLEHRDAAVKQQAQQLLTTRVPEDRQKVLAQYQAALKLPTDPQRGRALFEKNCAVCHRVAGIGVDVAPDISDSRTRTREALLNDILNPNAAIDSNYVQYTIDTEDGRVLTGIISSETASSVTLRRAENESDTILRQDIASISSSGASLMPEGLEKDIPVEDMAHLIAFLKDWRYLEGSQGAEESRGQGAEESRGRGE